MESHYTDEELIDSLQEDMQQPLPHLQTCAECAQRARNIKGLLAAMNAWTLEDYQALSEEMAQEHANASSDLPLQDIDEVSHTQRNVSENVYDILQEIFPIECGILESEMVRQISMGRPASAFLSGGGGAFAGLADVFHSTVKAADMIRAMLALREEVDGMTVVGASASHIWDHQKTRLDEILSMYRGVPEDSRRLAVELTFTSK